MIRDEGDRTGRTDRPPSWTRRDVLRVGSLTLAATAWPGMGRAEADPEKTAKARSVIVLWMAGGVTHIDSFDPKPDAPESVRGTLGTIDTTLPGVRFAESLPCLARVAHRITLVRSFSHDDNDHFLSQAYALSGRKVAMNQIMTEPNVGSIVAYLRGPRADLPGYITVPGITRPGPPPHNLFVPGWLGGAYAPFAVGGEPSQPDFTQGPNGQKGDAPEDLRVEALSFPEGLNETRLAGRAGLRGRVENALRAAEASVAHDAMESHFRGAFRLLGSPEVRRAFDSGREPSAVREAYGRTKIGGRCLLARRLVEAGARFVLVDYGYDPDYGNLWDNHCVPEQRQPHISEMARRPYHLAGMDRAFAALLDDLAARGLLESTLVVFLTEFGRTPKINPNGGRDHWGPAGSVFFAGGGSVAGQVIGGTDKHAAYPTARGHSHADIAATIYRALGIDAGTLLHDRQNRPLPVLPLGEPIPGVLAS